MDGGRVCGRGERICVPYICCYFDPRSFPQNQMNFGRHIRRALFSRSLPTNDNVEEKC